MYVLEKIGENSSELKKLRKKRMKGNELRPDLFAPALSKIHYLGWE